VVRELTERPGELVDAEIALEERRCIRLRRQIQRFAWTSDREHGLTDGETNKRLFRRFRKSRTKMDSTELKNVLAWINSGEYERLYPPPVVQPANLPPPQFVAPSNDADDFVEVAI
jgi:hypothetical protein